MDHELWSHLENLFVSFGEDWGLVEPAWCEDYIFGQSVLTLPEWSSSDLIKGFDIVWVVFFWYDNNTPPPQKSKSRDTSVMSSLNNKGWKLVDESPLIKMSLIWSMDQTNQTTISILWWIFPKCNDGLARHVWFWHGEVERLLGLVEAF